MKTRLNYLVFEVTSVCNLDCRYCYNTWKAPDGTAPARSSYKKAMRALRRAFRLADISHVTFTGGEPFLAERLPEIIMFCRMSGKSVTLISNGTYAKQDDWKQMIDLGVQLFELPLHSPDPAAHELMTGKPGSWNASLKSVRFLLESGAEVVIALVLTKINMLQVRETLQFLKNEGIDRVMLNRYNIGGRGMEQLSELLPDLESLRDAYRKADEASRDFKITITSNVCSPFCVLNPLDYRSIGFSSCTSDPARRPLTMDTEGNIRTCNHSPVVMGNIFNSSFKEILESDYALSWNKIIPEICADCKYWIRCLGGCRAASEQMGGGLDMPDPILYLNKKGMP